MDDNYDLNTGMIVISIILEPDRAPQIELDGCDPDIAAAVFRRAAELIEKSAEYPTITSKGEEIISDYIAILFDDEDDDDSGLFQGSSANARS